MRSTAPLLGTLAALATGLLLQAAPASLSLKGSDTMVILGQQWAEQYMKKTPGTTLQVTGGGSGTGISALINGTTDLAMSSRPMADKEKTACQTKLGRPPFELAVAKDGITLYVHPSNPVQSLTLEQLSAVYQGQLTNWKQLGGADVPIVLYGRENSSGTYVYFKEHVLGDEDFAPRTQTLPGTAAVVHAVSKEPRAIGYGGAAYAKGVKPVKLKASANGPAVEPSLRNVQSGVYPLSRNLYFYLREPPVGEAKRFLDWVLSPEGQALVTKVGYFPVR